MTVPFGLFYDFRNPTQKDWSGVYRGLLEQIEWAEREKGYDAVYLSEHHFVDDGYSPSLFTIAGALAERTDRMLIGTNIVQLPLHNPLRIAEDSLTVDAISGGRFRLGVANGYRSFEFEALGTSVRHRRARIEEGISILRSAFNGESFSREGTHWSFPELTVTPGSDRPGGPGIWIGGNSEPAIKRAARLGDGYFAVTDSDVQTYKAALEEEGRSLSEAPINRTYWTIIAEDPERALDSIGEHMLYQVNKYIEWGFLGDVPTYADARDVVADGVYEVWSGPEAVENFVRHHQDGVSEFQLFAVWPGEPFDSAAERLEYIADRVIPEVRARIA
jgi:alkanesulfonate monooxygenase SsuD/methylene tetrahydromethanopterin reductase-like flavin-dependent oxidoreductase (luciferase family)